MTLSCLEFILVEDIYNVSFSVSKRVCHMATVIFRLAWGFLLESYSNHSSKMHRFLARVWDRRTDKRTDSSFT